MQDLQPPHPAISPHSAMRQRCPYPYLPPPSPSQQACFWSLLTVRDFNFRYVSSAFKRALGNSHQSLLGLPFFDFIHPEEQLPARKDLGEYVTFGTFHGSMTRCRFSSHERIRRRLESRPSAFHTPAKVAGPSARGSAYFTKSLEHAMADLGHATMARADRCSDEEGYIITDIVMNIVSNDLILMCFHTNGATDFASYEQISRSGSHLCGDYAFSNMELLDLERRVREWTNRPRIMSRSPPTSPITDNYSSGPDPRLSNRVFQIFDRITRRALLTLPDLDDPEVMYALSCRKESLEQLVRVLPLDMAVSSLDRSRLGDGRDDPGGNARIADFIHRFYDKHRIASTYAHGQSPLLDVESLVIPYGDIIFACFKISPAPSAAMGSLASIPSSASSTTGPDTRSNSPASPSPRLSAFRRSSGSSYTSDKSALPGSLQPTEQLPPITIIRDGWSSPEPMQRVQPQTRPVITLPPPKSRLSGMHTSYIHSPPEPAARAEWPSPPHLPPPLPAYSASPPPPYQYHQPPPPPPPPILTPPIASPPFHGRMPGAEGINHQNQQFQHDGPHRHHYQPYPAKHQYPSMGGRRQCERCHTYASPEWRKGPKGQKTLCNACGLRHAREEKKRQQERDEQEELLRLYYNRGYGGNDIVDKWPLQMQLQQALLLKRRERNLANQRAHEQAAKERERERLEQETEQATEKAA